MTKFRGLAFGYGLERDDANGDLPATLCRCFFQFPLTNPMGIAIRGCVATFGVNHD
jgi:hypothetical protein